MIRKLDYGDFDRIFSLLTSGHGKVPVIAKGVRRPLSRLGSSLELYQELEVQLAEGRSLDVVLEAMPVPGPRISADPEHTAYAALVAEVMDRVTEDRHPIEGAFELTRLALMDLATREDPRPAGDWFIGAALNFLGVGPLVQVCARCRRRLPPEPARYLPSQGGFLCSACEPGAEAKTSLAALKVLRLMAAGDIQLYRRLKLEPELLAEVELVLESQLEDHLDRTLKSLRFLRQMRMTA